MNTHQRSEPEQAMSTQATQPTNAPAGAGKSVLISGASVAGPALAYWLSRYGFRTTVVERAPALREGGYAVDFRGTAHLSVLERMGILGDIEAARTNMGAMSYVNDAGRRIASMPADLFAGDVEILRGDLARILHDATKDRTEYVFGDSIADLAEDENGVEVSFERGAPRRFDLVVGADGLHSRVRALAFGPEQSFVRPSGLSCAIFTTANHLGLDHTGLAYLNPGKIVTMYSARGNTEAKVVFYFATAGRPGADAAPHHDRRDLEQQKKIVAQTYAGVGWETPRLLSAMWDATDFYFDSISQVRMDTWTEAGWRCSAMPPGARRRCRAWVRGWPWSARTFWPVSSRPPPATTERRSRAIEASCATTFSAARRWVRAWDGGWSPTTGSWRGSSTRTTDCSRTFRGRARSPGLPGRPPARSTSRPTDRPT